MSTSDTSTGTALGLGLGDRVHAMRELGLLAVNLMCGHGALTDSSTDLHRATAGFAARQLVKGHSEAVPRCTVGGKAPVASGMS